ncbi:hypothetical protein [Carnobacterium antarcticum]|uniref:Phage protein n=1 Tax=Carnobacterium antarcticum TaxID=2126436 RepID=A0ABW4NLX8_9LACT|nr:hypothetical protein [Carnobacterium sp. CP1]ALV21044.1 hypothetical protein NY10_424 [Carnobacterium sp. CP1]
MIIDLNVAENEKEKLRKIGKVIFEMNELGMIDSSDFTNLINIVNDRLVLLKEDE